MSKSRRTLRENLHFRLGRSLNEALLRLPPEELTALNREVQQAAGAAHLLYQDTAGALRSIPLLLRPRVLSREQKRYFHKTCVELIRALESLYALWVDAPAVQALLPLTPGERAWFDAMPKGAHKAPQSIFGRLDVQVDFSDEDWAKNCHFFEPNSVGAGGIHYTPVADAIIEKIVVPRVQKSARHFMLQVNDDPRLLLLHTLTAHGDEIGARRLNLAFVQDRRGLGGPEEFTFLAEFMNARGLTAVVADPRDLVLRGEQLWAGDVPVDVLYRDTSIADLAEWEAEGTDLGAMRWAFAQNRVVSTITGDFDHKSTFEIFTDPAFDALFSTAQRRIFRKHVPWTRAVRETTTLGPDLRIEIDLVPFIRKNRDQLVLKPNRAFGGEGVVIGPHCDLHDWDDALARAVRDPGSTVVQRYVPALVKDFPVVDAEERVTLEEFYVVCGFYATSDGLGILGRASKRRVVNVAQKGALCACLVLM
ncbi:MAG TPA: hypothetical protein VG389_07970 [Myxococcota bacterium]|nr:hypothetical protein [Myxococcota bacterium]